MDKDKVLKVVILVVLVAGWLGFKVWQNRKESRMERAAFASHQSQRVYRMVFDISGEKKIFGQLTFTYDVTIEELYEIEPGHYCDLSSLGDNDRFIEFLISQNPVHGQTMRVGDQRLLLEMAKTRLEEMANGNGWQDQESQKRRPIYKEALASGQVLVPESGDKSWVHGLGFLYVPLKLPLLPSSDFYEFSKRSNEYEEIPRDDSP